MKKNSTENDKIKLNINKDGSELNDFLISWNNFGKRPNKLSIHNTYSTEPFSQLLEDLIVEKNVSTEIIATEEGNTLFNQEVYCKINDNIYLSYFIIDKTQPTSVVTDVTFFYKEQEDYDEIKEIVEQMNLCLPSYTETENHNLFNIKLSNNTIDIEPLVFDDDFDNIELYYSELTFKELNKLIKKIRKNDKGLYLFNGEVGTGKTTSIKYIISEVDKMFFHIPGNLIEHTINNPDFRNFLKKYDNPVIILDDCESTLIDMFGKTNNSTFNILQLIDGLSSDSLKLSVICIFNEEIEENNSLLDCNNLISIVDFESLSSEEATELSKNIGSNKTYKNKTRLVDIIRKKNIDRYKKIGF
jgi:hypothetical protein